LGIEELQLFISKISSVKKTMKKIYDKQVMALLMGQQLRNKDSSNRFVVEDIEEQESISNSTESICAKEPKSNLH
jgi:hypothetical protein